MKKSPKMVKIRAFWAKNAVFAGWGLSPCRLLKQAYFICRNGFSWGSCRVAFFIYAA